MRQKRPPEEKRRLLDDLLQKKIHEPDCNVNYLAQNLGVTRQHVYDLTRQHHKKSPQERIETERIVRSIEQLIHEPETILYQVAETSGFANYRTFHRAFKRRTGFSPSEFKEEADRAECKIQLKNSLYAKLGHKVCKQHKRLD